MMMMLLNIIISVREMLGGKMGDQSGPHIHIMREGLQRTQRRTQKSKKLFLFFIVHRIGCLLLA